MRHVITLCCVHALVLYWGDPLLSFVLGAALGNSRRQPTFKPIRVPTANIPLVGLLAQLNSHLQTESKLRWPVASPSSIWLGFRNRPNE